MRLRAHFGKKTPPLLAVAGFFFCILDRLKRTMKHALA
jgi:hypothetical protein